jgi:ribosomal protein L19E
MLTIREINERASNKAFAKILSIKANQVNLEEDLKNGSYGPITKEEIQLLIKQNNIEIDVWNYIAKLIETDNNGTRQSSEPLGFSIYTI